ncbi:hypothetical protein [Streptomyces sp. NPDC020965]|uniref:hypothetical protein n=1 Tax=Streptomyces sp. NPDC020965 TaxID=3365105 RepID=UPI003789628D
MSPEPLSPYSIQKMPKGQRRAMLAAIDAGGRLPADTPARTLNALPEAWARTEPRTGLRWLTGAGRTALIPLDRFLSLKRANPETGMTSSLNHAAGCTLSRDGLIVFRDPTGQPVDAVDRWAANAFPYITVRGRKLVGMPLTAPAFSARMPMNSRAIWRRSGKPDILVYVYGWPMSDGTVRVWPCTWSRHHAEREVPANELRPLPRRVRHLHSTNPPAPIRAARARMERISPAARPSGEP